MEIKRINHVTVLFILSHPTEKPMMHKVPMLIQKCVNVVRNKPQCSIEYTTVAAILIAPSNPHVNKYRVMLLICCS